MTTAIPPTVFAQIIQTNLSPEGIVASLNTAEATYSPRPKHLNAKRVYPFWKTCTICSKPYPCRTRAQASRNKTCSAPCTALRLSLAPRKRKPLPVCQQCGNLFAPAKGKAYAKARFCGYECAAANRMAQPGARERLKSIGATARSGWTDASRESYRQKMTGEGNPAWKGGVTYFRKHGSYKTIKYVRCPQEFLPMARKDGYVMEHRLFVAQALGRCLERTETVHHANHDPQDNRLENLQLFTSNQAHKLFEHRGTPPPLWSG